MAELSFGVDQVLAALERDVGREATAAGWLVALVGRARDEVVAAAPGHDVDAVIAGSVAGEPLTRGDVADLACSRADARWRRRPTSPPRSSTRC